MLTVHKKIVLDEKDINEIMDAKPMVYARNSESKEIAWKTWT